MTHVSDIKLIRTDTTLDLSQRAEKGMLCLVSKTFLYFFSARALAYVQRCGAKVISDAKSSTTKHSLTNDPDRKLHSYECANDRKQQKLLYTVKNPNT